MLEQEFYRSHVLSRVRKNDLGRKLDDLADHLLMRGHPPSTVRRYVQAAEHFGNWLRMEKHSITNVDERIVGFFLHKHLPVCNCPPPAPRHHNCVRVAALNHLLLVLRENEVRPSSAAAQRQTSVDLMVDAFQEHLEKVCGLAKNTLIYRTRYAREFLEYRFGEREIEIGEIGTTDLMEFVYLKAETCKPRSLRAIASSLRSLLRFLQFKGLCDANLIAAVPTFSCRMDSNVPNRLSDEQLGRFLSSFDRDHSTGQRDYAMALCMVDLGLRGSEVAGLCLEDFDWRKGIIQIRSGKARRSRIMPMPLQVGEAVAYYLRNGRPKTFVRNIFVRHSVPIGARLDFEHVRGAMRRAYARASLPSQWTGTHILRHTAATRMFQGGANLKEVADVLGHRCIDTTKIYTKVNLTTLATVPMPWPEVES